MQRLLRVVPLLFLALAAAAAPLAAQSESRRPPRDRNFITEEEVRAAIAENAYDLVRSLRPHWLRMRGETTMRITRSDPRPGDDPAPTPQEIVLYVDGTRFGAHPDLRNLPAAEVATVRFFDAASATQRWGTGHTSGAILVTRRGRS